MVLFHIVHVHSYRYSHGISILLGLGTPSIVPFLCAIPPGSQNTHATWPTALPSLSFTIITSGLGKSICGVIVNMGRSVQKMGGDVVIGHSI